VVSPNTIAKAYSEREHSGLLELRHGSGAYVSVRRSQNLRSGKIRQAKERVRRLVESLHHEGLSADEIRRVFEAEVFYRERKRRIA